MTDHLRACTNCQKVFNSSASNCPICGRSFSYDHMDKRFLSSQGSYSSQLAQLPPDTRLSDRFIIKECIGRGAIGFVYHAYDQFRNDEVAIKIIDIGPCGDDAAIKSIYNEIEIQQKISDFRHIIRINDMHFLPWEGTILLILSMEVAAGGTYRRWLNENKDDAEIRRSAGINHFIQICQGIQVIHDAGAVHLDIKPENMLLKNSDWKVSDFGSACLKQRASGYRTEAWGVDDSEGGTAIYMSPESFSATDPAHLTPAADIYALGVILYETVSSECRPPFIGSFSRLHEMHINATPTKLSDVDANISRVIERCLQKDPRDRYENIQHLLDDLKGNDSEASAESAEICESAYNASKEEEAGMWEKALGLFNESKFNEANEQLTRIFGINSAHSDALEMQKKIQSRYSQAEELYQYIMGQLDTQNLRDLIELLKQAINVYPEHPAGRVPQELVAAKATAYRKAMEDGTRMFNDQRWESALHFFTKAIQIDDASTNLRVLVERLSLIEDYRKKEYAALAVPDTTKAFYWARAMDVIIETLKYELAGV